MKINVNAMRLLGAKYLQEAETERTRQAASDKLAREQAERTAEIERKKQAAYIRLNNLYLDVQRGKVKMSVAISNELRSLPNQAYDSGDSMIEWWCKEFIRLPRWNDF